MGLVVINRLTAFIYIYIYIYINQSIKSSFQITQFLPIFKNYQLIIKLQLGYFDQVKQIKLTNTIKQ